MEKENLFLSIIIPTYNVDRFLGECLDSCLRQDLDKSLYEIVCVDDGSTDDSGRILDAYAENNDNIVAVHQKNGGVSVARNRGLEEASGEYYWFVDPDDFIQEDFLQLLYTTVQAHDYPDMVTFGMYEFGDYSADCSLSEEERLHKKDLKNNRAPNEEFDATLCRHLYKSEIFRKSQLRFDPVILACEDNVVHFIYEGQVASTAMVEQVGYFYRKRPNSLSSGTAEFCYESRVRIATLFLDYYRQNYGNHYIAGYLLSSQLKMALDHISKMKNPRRKNELKRLKALHLFPLSIDPKDTCFVNKRSGDSAADRRYNEMYNSIYTLRGYRYIRTAVVMKKIKQRLHLK